MLSSHTPRTPIDIPELAAELSLHPDSSFRSFLLHGLTHGFRIGYNGPRDFLISKNLSSAIENPEIVDNYLADECVRGHTAGPFDTPPCMPFRSAGLGVVPKKSGGHRLIVHLSAPYGSSINDGICKESHGLQYITVDDVIQHVVQLGLGALMFKVDIKHAFRLIPVHRDDWSILGMVWRDKYFVDKVLPFGLRSSPALFNHFAEAVCWVLRNNNAMAHLEHYLDDFMGVAAPSTSVATSTAAIQKATMLQVFSNLGIPVATGEDKVVGPTTVMTVLGIEVDSVAQESRLPADKLLPLLSLLKDWQGRSSASKRELLSLIGHLSFAAKVVPPGRTFIRRLLDLSCTVSGLSAPLTVTDEARRDIQWWLDFASTWNGKSVFHDLEWTRSPDFDLYTDASDLGFGGYFQGRWFLERWPAEFVQEPIMVRELVPIAVACALWGESWKGKKLLFHCDNLAVVMAWEKGACKNKLAMHFVRFILAKAAMGNFIVYIQHIAGVDNCLADALSRLQVRHFKELAPSASDTPEQLPLDVELHSILKPTDW